MKIKTDDPLAFICLRNYDAFQYTEAGRPRRTGERRRWARLHISMLTSSDWIQSDAHTKVVMTTLIMLATQYQNRIPNDHAYISHLAGLAPEQVTGPLKYLMGSTGKPGFIELTLDSKPDEGPTVKKAKPRPKGTDIRFDDFWKVYPNRKDKKLARERWRTNDLDKHADEIIAAVKVQAKHEDWTKQNGQFVPLPSTYLNKERWKDEETQVGKQPGELGYTERWC